ncbi:MAG TPA: hypothetical protein VIO15_07095, partial [Bacteroidales bacterium]
KKIQILLVVFLGFTNVIKSQSKENAAYSTNIEIFINKPGVAIEKEFIELGNLDEIDVRLLKAKDLKSGGVCFALQFEYQSVKPIMPFSMVTFIDRDELEALTDALKLFQSIITQIDKSNNNKELKFMSRSGAVVGCFFKRERCKWMTYFQLKYNESKSTVVIENDGFDFFMSLISLAKDKIEAESSGK